MDLEPRFVNLNRAVLFCAAIGGILLAMLMDISRAGDHWISVVPLISFIIILIIYFHLWAQFWFWAVLAPLLMAQLALAWLFTMPKIETGASLFMMGAVLIDVVAMIAFIKFIGNKFRR